MGGRARAARIIASRELRNPLLQCDNAHASQKANEPWSGGAIGPPMATGSKSRTGFTRAREGHPRFFVREIRKGKRMEISKAELTSAAAASAGHNSPNSQ